MTQVVRVLPYSWGDWEMVEIVDQQPITDALLLEAAEEIWDRNIGAYPARMTDLLVAMRDCGPEIILLREHSDPDLMECWCDDFDYICSEADGKPACWVLAVESRIVNLMEEMDYRDSPDGPVKQPEKIKEFM